MDRLHLSENWTSEIAFKCSQRCAEFGDPPCWELSGDQRQGETPQVIEPCGQCLPPPPTGEKI